MTDPQEPLKDAVSLDWLHGFQSALEHITQVIWPSNPDADALTELDQKLAELRQRIRELHTQYILEHILFL